MQHWNHHLGFQKLYETQYIKLFRQLRLETLDSKVLLYDILMTYGIENFLMTFWNLFNIIWLKKSFKMTCQTTCKPFSKQGKAFDYQKGMRNKFDFPFFGKINASIIKWIVCLRNNLAERDTFTLHCESIDE